MTVIFIIIGLATLLYFNSRITDLERKVRELSSGRTTHTSVAETPVARETFGEEPLVETVATPAYTSPVAEAPAAPAKHDGEFALGSRWFTGAGVIAVLLGVGFFFRYAFQNNLISEPFRILLGFVFGLALMGVGVWLKSKYRAYGLSLIGVGLGAIYLSFYAAYAFYALIPAFVSFMLVIAVIVIGTVLAVMYDAKQMAATSLAGGYVGILLFLAHLSYVGVFASLILLCAFLLAVSYKKRWPETVTLGVIFSTLSLLVWNGLGAHPVSEIQTLVGGIYALFAFATLFNFAHTKESFSPWQTFNLYAVPIFYFLVAGSALNDKKGYAYLAFGIALFYFIIVLAVRAFAASHVALQKFLEVARLIIPAFIALGIGLYFEGSLPAMLLAVEGAVVVAAGRMFNNKYQYVFGHLVLIASMFFAWLYVLVSDTASAPFIFNERTLTLVVVTLGFTAAWYAHRFIKSTLDESMSQQGRMANAVLMYVMFMTTALTEVARSVAGVHEGTYLAITASVVAIIMFLLGHIAMEKSLRYGSYVVVMMTAIYTTLISVLEPQGTTLFNVNVASMAGVVVLSAIMYVGLELDELLATEFAQVRRMLLICSNVTVLTVLTMEIHHYFVMTLGNAGGNYLERVSISLFWLVYGVMGLVLGIAARSTFSRQVAAVLFVITTLKVFLYDSQALDDLYRFVSFIGLGVILLVVGYLYYRYKERINSFVGIPTAQPPVA